ncbi:MAG TPA: efflux RND transporter periplasmic adaptor subunit [Caldimonas sp.]|jgi:RND family efflux transporter MFP subunit|nr:efflux RND transporter periplasmic adaptor subunit [Caldimonas sp.]HEX4235650.1 efflux RND transporter periplasmic adaptor subunit [Caldimonas sp.]
MQHSSESRRPAHKARRRLWLGIFGGAVLVALAAAVLSKTQLFQGDKDKSKDPVPLEFVAAEVARPVSSRLPVTIEFSGPLVAPRTAIVRAKAAGSLLSLNVAEGSRVKAGQVIGAIDLSDLQSRAADRAALVESAQASLIEAQRQHAANVGLAAQNFISPTALQTSQARLDAARAQLKSAEAQLASSNVGLREAALAAPIPGIVGKRHVVPGEKVSAEQPVVTVVDLSTLELAGSVGTHEVSLLAPGQPAMIRIEGNSDPVPGRIDRIAPAAEAGTRAIGVVVVLDNHDERFRAGQYAQATVSLADTTQRMTVPIAAVGQASGQDYVWTIEKGALVRRIIVTGRRDVATGRIEVVKGLDPDAQILAMRFDNLKEGAPAKVVGQRTTLDASSLPSSARVGSSSPSASASAVPVPRS